MVCSLAKIKHGDHAKYLRAERYYQGEHSRLVWWGAGAEQLGLTGPVQGDDFAAVWSGQTPDGRRVANFGRNRVGGWDFTFGADKQTTLLAVQGSPEVRARIERNLVLAALDAMRWVEQEAAAIRRGKGGCRPEKAALVAAYTLHATARPTTASPSAEGDPPAPHLHVHVAVASLGLCGDGAVGCLDGRRFYQGVVPTAGALFRAGYSARNERDLGTLYERQGWKIQLAGPPSLGRAADHCSPRRQQIEQRLAALGTRSARASEKAALDTRLRKGEASLANPTTLLPHWQRQADRHGFTAQEARSLLGRAPARDLAREARQAVDRAVASLTAEKSHFSDFEFLRAVATEGAGCGLDAGQVRSITRSWLGSRNVVALAPDKNGRPRFTTPEVLELEKRLLTMADDLAADRHFRPDEAAVNAVLARHPQLSDEQRRAVVHLTRDTGRLALLTGYAGTGKSTTLRVLNEIYSGANLTVCGAAVSGKAAQGLEESSGIASTTLVRRIGSRELKLPPSAPLGPGDVLVIDEASMLGTRSLARALALARHARKVVLVGDCAQLPAVAEAGAPFATLAQRLGHTALTSVSRQRDEADRRMVLDLAEGQVARALHGLARRDGLVLRRDQGEAMAALVRDWGERHALQSQDAIILAATRAECARLNRLCQDERRRRGALGPALVAAGEDVFHLGERVLLTRNSRRHRVTNGTLATITGYDERRQALTVRPDGRPRTVTLDGYAAENVLLGYSLTGHKSQGATCGETFVHGTSAFASAEMLYVELSRHQHRCRLYLSEEDAGPELHAFVRAAQRSRRKDLAHDHLDAQQACPSAGLPVVLGGSPSVPPPTIGRERRR